MEPKAELEKKLLAEIKFLEDTDILPQPDIFIEEHVPLTQQQHNDLDELALAQLDEMWNAGLLSSEQKYQAISNVLNGIIFSVLEIDEHNYNNFLQLKDWLRYFNWDTLSKEHFLNFVNNWPGYAFAGAKISPIPATLRVMTIDQLHQVDNALDEVDLQMQED